MKLLRLVVLLSLSNHSLAQIKLSGILEDASTREKIQFAHISFQNSSKGTSSNTDGYFELSMIEPTKYDSIQISHISYKTKKIGIASLGVNLVNLISLEPDKNVLPEVVVLSKSPEEYLLSTINKAKESLKHPFSAKYYFRELVKHNEEYSKYSDAILVGNFPADKEQMQVAVEESRVVNLPMESDDLLNTISPIDVSKILEHQYLNLLNLFTGEKKKFYDIQLKSDADNPKRVMYEITPAVKPEKNKLLFYSWILTEDDNIKHIKMVSDSLCDWQKSLFGFTVKVNSYSITLNFKEVSSSPILVHGIVELRMDFLHKKFNQKNQYLSEFVALDVNENSLLKMEKSTLLKSKTLYKNGSNYSTKFWEGDNIPIRTEEERKLLDRLVEHDQSKNTKQAK